MLHQPITERKTFEVQVAEATQAFKDSALERCRGIFLSDSSKLTLNAKTYLANKIDDSSFNFDDIFCVGIKKEGEGKKAVFSVTLTDEGKRFFHQLSLIDSAALELQKNTRRGWTAGRITKEVFTLSELTQEMARVGVPGNDENPPIGTWKKYLDQFGKWEAERQVTSAQLEASYDELRLSQDFPAADSDSPLCKSMVRALAKLSKTIVADRVIEEVANPVSLPATALPFYRSHPILTWGAVATAICALAVYSFKGKSPSNDGERKVERRLPVATSTGVSDVMLAAEELVGFNRGLAQMKDAQKQQILQTVRDFDGFVDSIKSPVFRSVFVNELNSALLAPDAKTAEMHIDKCSRDARLVTEGLKKFVQDLQTLSVTGSRVTGGGILETFFMRNPELIELKIFPMISEEFKLRVDEILSPSPGFAPQPIFPQPFNPTVR